MTSNVRSTWKRWSFCIPAATKPSVCRKVPPLLADDHGATIEGKIGPNRPAGSDGSHLWMPRLQDLAVRRCGEIPVRRRSADAERFGEFRNRFSGGGETTELLLSLKGEFGRLGGR